MGGDPLPPYTHLRLESKSPVGAGRGWGAGVAGTPQVPPGRLDRSGAQGELVDPGGPRPPWPLGAQSAAGGLPSSRGVFRAAALSCVVAAPSGWWEAGSVYLPLRTAPSSARLPRLQEPGALGATEPRDGGDGAGARG